MPLILLNLSSRSKIPVTTMYARTVGSPCLDSGQDVQRGMYDRNTSTLSNGIRHNLRKPPSAILILHSRLNTQQHSLHTHSNLPSARCLLDPANCALNLPVGENSTVLHNLCQLLLRIDVRNSNLRLEIELQLLQDGFLRRRAEDEERSAGRGFVLHEAFDGGEDGGGEARADGHPIDDEVDVVEDKDVERGFVGVREDFLQVLDFLHLVHADHVDRTDELDEGELGVHGDAGGQGGFTCAGRGRRGEV
jgi:hypothetical protein